MGEYPAKDAGRSVKPKPLCVSGIVTQLSHHSYQPWRYNMKFEFTLDEVNVIMAALGRAPYEQVFQLVENIRKQAAPQLPEMPAPAPETPTQ